MEISKRDWKLFREKVPEWQERYMEHLCQQYAELLDSDKPGADRFWELWDRIRKDRKHTGVIIEMTRSKTIVNLLQLIREGAITMDDLHEFSEDLQKAVRFFIKS